MATYQLLKTPLGAQLIIPRQAGGVGCRLCLAGWETWLAGWQVWKAGSEA